MMPSFSTSTISIYLEGRKYRSITSSITVSAFPQNPNEWGVAARQGIDWIELVDSDQIYEYFNGGIIIRVIKGCFDFLAYF